MKKPNIVFWLALTPALSPGERENRSQISCVTKVSCNSFVSRSELPKNGTRQSNFLTIDDARLLPPLLGGEGRGEGERSTNSPANHQEAATDKLTIELSETCDSCPLSPGERARVRASVNLTFLFSHNPRPRVIRQRMRCAFLQRVENYIPHELFLASQLPVPETKFLDPHRSEELCSLRIVSLLSGMPVMSAIEFNGETGFHAVEVEVVDPARVVAAELVTVEPAVAQPTPHELFGPSWFLAQSAGASGVGHGKKVMRLLRKEKNGVHDRPHPSPLPQERVNRSLSSCVIKRTYYLCVSPSELPRCEDRQCDTRLTKDVRKLSPLPGGEGQGEGERHTNILGGFKKLDSTTALTPALSPRRGRNIRQCSSNRTVLDCSIASEHTSDAETGGVS